MKSAPAPKEPLLYPPLSDALKARMRKAGHGDMVEVLDNMTEKTIEGLLRATRAGTMFSAKTSKRAA